MKYFKVALCALLVLCGSLAFAACGKNKVFDESKISFEEDSVVFDKQSHMFNVNYEGLGFGALEVSYALQTEDGKPGTFSKDLSFVTAGSYNVYYRISAKGYKTYEASEPRIFTITRRQVNFTILSDWLTKGGNFEYTSDLPNSLSEDGDRITWEYRDTNTSEIVEVENLTPGEQVAVQIVPADSYFATNYNCICPSVTLTVVDNYAVKQGDDIQYGDSLSALVNTIEQDAEIYLYEDAVVTEPLMFQNSVKIVGNGKSIIADPDFYVPYEAKEIIHFAAEDGSLTLENVEINGNNTVGCVYVENSTLVLNEGARILNGRAVVRMNESADEDKLTGGVKMVGNSTLLVNGGRVENNHNAFENDREFVGDGRFKYAANLWLAPEVTANLNYGHIENVWVDVDNSANRAGVVTIEQAEEQQLSVSAVYLHNDGQRYASAEYKAGAVDSFVTYFSGEEVLLPAYQNMTYSANSLYLVSNSEDSEHNFYPSFAEAVAQIQADGGKLTMFADAVINQQITIEKGAEIEADGHKISAASEFAQAMVGANSLVTMFYLPAGIENVIFKISNATLNGNNAARVITALGGGVMLSNVNVTNGRDKDSFKAGGLFFSNDASANLFNCEIFYNTSSDSDSTSEEFFMEGDVWVGANATVSIDGTSRIGYVYANANSYSANGKGLLSVIDGEVNHIWLEFDGGYGADLSFNGGTIAELKIDLGNEVETIVPEVGNVYRGGERQPIEY